MTTIEVPANGVNLKNGQTNGKTNGKINGNSNSNGNISPNYSPPSGSPFNKSYLTSNDGSGSDVTDE